MKISLQGSKSCEEGRPYFNCFLANYFYISQSRKFRLKINFVPIYLFWYFKRFDERGWEVENKL